MGTEALINFSHTVKSLRLPADYRRLAMFAALAVVIVFIFVMGFRYDHSSLDVTPLADTDGMDPDFFICGDFW